MLFPSRQSEYPDDIFSETRMSFGEHIEVLRTHLLRAIKGLLVVLFGGLLLDGLGQYLGRDDVGLGRPMLKLIVDPAESQVRAFYARRNEQVKDKLNEEAMEEFMANRPDDPEVKRVRAKFLKYDMDTGQLTPAEQRTLREAPAEMPVVIPTKAFEDAFGLKRVDPTRTEIEVKMKVYPTYLNYLGNRGETLLGNKQYLTTLSVQEAMVVYFKVALLCSVVVASPWIFFQIWSFVAAGLYPHERAYVYKFLGPSIGLFLAGVLLCQFVVLPGAVKALIAFNNWIELDPDLRLNEWLGFALLLPLVFGVSFQTPLVMFFLNRIGVFGWEDYWSKIRHAVLVLAFFAAVITPTPDAVTMMYLFVPMFGLYLIGLLVCKYFPPPHVADGALAAAGQVAV